MKQLQGKVALITGASRGIGFATALELAKNGADIALNYYPDEKEAQAAQKEIKGLGVKCEIYKFDVSNFADSEEAVKRILSDFSKVDILVNNAGITRDKLVAQMKEEDFDLVISINLKGVFNLIKHLYPNYIKNRSGSIINIASVVGLMGSAGQANYAASKAGVIGITKTVARELGSRGVTCNAIAPGFIETDMTNQLTEAVKQKYFDLIPLKRAGTPEEVAKVALFFATAPYITGEVIKIDGGLYI